MKQPRQTFALCVDNSDYEASLVLGKVYPILSDPVAAKDDLVRIVDESGEDYLYNNSHFELVDFPPAVEKSCSRCSEPPNAIQLKEPRRTGEALLIPRFVAAAQPTRSRTLRRSSWRLRPTARQA